MPYRIVLLAFLLLTASGSLPPAVAAQGPTPLCAARGCASVPLDAGWRARGSRAAPGLSSATTASTSATGLAAAPTVSVADVNPEGNQLRGGCLRFSAGPDAEVQCSDLVVAHAAPALRLMNRAHAPVLVYNQQTHAPFPVVGANVTVAASAGTPDSVRATLTLTGSGTIVATGSWRGSDFVPGSTRRIALGFSASSLATGLYPYALEVRAYYGGTPQPATASGVVQVINRAASPFGAGWWLSGLESIQSNYDYSMTWMGADGSVRRYRPETPGVWGRWVADALVGPDTLVQNGSYYIRTQHGSGQVWFDGNGHHVYTVNRLGQRTAFEWSGDRLVRIRPGVNTGIDTSYTYALDYVTLASGRVVLSAIRSTGAAAGAARTLQVGTDATGRVTWLQDPDSSRVWMEYPGTGSWLWRLTDARGSRTEITQDSAGRVGTVRRYGGGTVSTAADVVTRYHAPERDGLATAPRSAAPDWGWVHAELDGPRQDAVDVTQVWLDRYGAPRHVVDALGSATALYREDARFPALVTKVDAPGATFNGSATRMVSTAAYDARGNVVTSTVQNPRGDGATDTTTYAYENAAWPDFATKVTSPTGLVRSTYYDAAGNRRWEQTGPSATRRVNYGYNARGQVDSVWSAAAQARGEAPEIIEYGSPLGNVSAVQSPLGIRTEYLEDVLGRVIRTRSPMPGGGYASDSTAYDVADRVADSYGYGPAVAYERVSDGAPRTTVPLLLRVHNAYDLAGLPLRVERWSVPDSAGIDTVRTRWRYDALGRQVAEVAPDGAVDSVVYDPAGNVTKSINRKGEEIRTRYDALGRPTSRAMSANTSVTPAVPGDSASFAYDGSGAMVRADNDVARVRRHHYPGGTLKSDTLWVAGEAGFASGLHVYVQGYAYDREGRRRTHDLPANLVPIPTPRIQYGYDLATGALDTITDPLGSRYRFAYTADGQLDTLSLPGGIAETYHYDADGRMTRRVRGSLYADSLEYEVRGKTVRALTMAETAQMAYDGLGHLAWSHTHQAVPYRDNPDSEEEYGSDALGNTTFRRLTGLSATQGIAVPGIPTKHGYQAGTGRHLSSAAPAPGYSTTNIADVRAEAFAYDAAGNLTASSIQQGQILTGTTGGGPGSMVFLAQRTDTLTSLHPDPRARQTDTVTYDGVDNPAAREVTQQVYNQYTYRADGKLVQFQRTAGCLRYVVNGDCATQYPAYTSQNRTETYRYDALGRRVFVRTTTPTGSVLTGQALCDDGLHRCDNTTRRTVWDGDQILAETRYPNAQADQDSGLDSVNVAERARRDTIATTDEGHVYGGHNTSWWAPHGRVVYVHGGGTDQPLGLIRSDYSYDFPDPVLIVPHANWRGAYETSTFVDGTQDRCKTVWLPSNEVIRRGSDGRLTFPEQGPDTTQVRCIERDFPGAYMGMTRLLKRQSVYGPIAWQGSLVQDGYDASGLSYRRNRYYDPSTGRFTQEDPIGIAGGLNVYGFAGGDPVNYSDPYGLAPCPPDNDCETQGHTGQAVQAAKDWFSALGNRIVDTAVAIGQVAGEISGMSDFVRAGWGWDPSDPSGPSLSAGQRLAAGGMLILATPVPEGRVAANLRRTVKAAGAADVTVTRIGTFFRATWEVAGHAGGESRAVYVKDINAEGRTVRMYKDTYDRAGVFQHRKFKFPNDHIAY